MPERVVVAGAGFGGITAAIELARKGFKVEVIDKESFSEYTPGLIDIFRNRVTEEKLKVDLNDYFENTLVDFSREKILGFNLDENKVETDSGSHSYDYLVLALGSEAATYGMDLSEAESCYSLRDARKLDRELNDSEDAVVIGCGYVGIEIATELDKKNIEVTVVDGSTRPVASSGENVSEKVLDYLNKNNIDFRGGIKVKKVKSDLVKLENGEEIKTDTVIWSGGIQASKLVQNYFDTEPGGIPVNPGLSSEQHHNVFALGDNADSGFLEVAQNAEEQAEVLAENVDKSENETLEEYSKGLLPLIISLGDTAILSVGNRAIKNRFFRHLKDLVRIRYYINLKKRKLKLRLGM
jgi:NADH dehydrogenase